MEYVKHRIINRSRIKTIFHPSNIKPSIVDIVYETVCIKVIEFDIIGPVLDTYWAQKI